MDLPLQKGTELGVTRFVPLFSERSVVQLKGERLARKMAHWQGVTVAACEQSGRNRLPTLATPVQLGELAPEIPQGGIGLLMDPKGRMGLSQLAEEQARAGIALAIGPEGGFSDSEREQLIRAGYQGLRLGPRVLRTETAGLATIAALQALYGDMT